MSTIIQFGSFLSKQLASPAARVVVGPNGSLHLNQLTQLQNISPFSALPLHTTDPLHLKSPTTSSVSVWHMDKDTKAQIQITFAHFDNTLSRNMGLLRTDTLASTVASNVPSSGDAVLTLVVKSTQEAFAAGLAAARNWPVYSRKSKSASSDRTVYVDFIVADGGSVDYAELQSLTDAIRNTQRLVDTPCSERNTDTLIAEAKTLAESVNKVRRDSVMMHVIRGEELRERGFGGIYAVGKAAEFPPALVVMTYTPTKTCTKSVAFVGKGIVYDCGGLSLKPTTSMCTMKTDCGGACAALGAFQAIATTGLATAKVHLLLCLAENAIDAKSFRNDDVVTHYSGKTSEINNTDAEGRLVLADGVAYASKDLKPDVIIDIATLTGAQMINTGKVHAGLLSRTEDAEVSMVAAGKATGDLCFPMLYAPELLLKNFESPIADLKNSVTDRSNAQSSSAGHFVEYHLAEDYKGHWIHLDIAGPSTHTKDRASGFGVGLLYQYVKSL